MEMQLRRRPKRRRWFWQRPKNNLPVRLRLSLLMLLLYAAPGAIVPLFTLRLQELGFSPMEMGLCCATQALGTMLAPLLAGQIADRWIAPERCLSVCAVVAALLLWLMGSLTNPAAVLFANLIFWLVMAPAMTLSTAVCFAQMGDRGREYGRIRMWGTIGWVAPLWLMGIWLSQLEWLKPFRAHGELSDAFRLASILAALFGLYVLTLPHTRPCNNGGTAAPLKALRLLHGRAFFVYALCTFGVCVVLPFSTQLTPLLLASLGVPNEWLLPALTIAQASEVASLGLLPLVMARFGVRGTMRLGLLAAVLTLTSLMVGHPLALALGGLGLYGLCISCYLVAGQVYLNHRVSVDVRASAQALHSVLCGAGILVGHLLVGFVRSQVGAAFAPTFAVAVGIALTMCVVFLVGFPADTQRRD